MVWFQCEDCGENLKKPKLPNHFRICSASKLSCIDCGEIFGQQAVQGHTQCMTEAEKYGPKGQGKVSNGTNAKPNKNSKQQPDIDINVGLSERPPWFCRLCNTKATSRQTLILHAEGKKHKAKARAHHAAKQQSKQTEAASDTNVSTENTSKGELADKQHIGEPKMRDLAKVGMPHVDLETVNGKLPSTKKRKFHAPETDGSGRNGRTDTLGEAGNGEVIQAEREKAGETEKSSKKAKRDVRKEDKMAECLSTSTKEDTEKKIKWKKLIASALKSNPDGVLKLKKLRKQVLKALLESGVQEDKTQLSNMLEHKINSSSRFTVEGKYVSLAAKD